MKISKYQWGSPIEGWGYQWKDRLQPSARSKVLQKWNASGKKPKPESSNEYTKRRVKEETKRTWRSDAADIAHGIGEGVLALHPYTAIPYYGAKVGQDVINGNVNWNTALNASIPLFHLSPQAVGLREATNVALENVVNTGSKTAKNWRPNISVTADIGTTAKQGTNALSQEEIQKAFEGARQWHLNRINSEAWKARASKAGFTNEEIPQLQKQLSDQIKRLTLTTEESIFGKNASITSNAGNAQLAASYMQYYDPVTKQIRMGISLGSPNISFNEAFRKFVHEFGHGATFGLNGTETSGVGGFLANKFPLINKLVKYNKSLYPEISEKSVSETLPEVNKYWTSQAIDNPKLLNYFAQPTEMQSRGYEFLLNSAAAKNILKRTLNIEPTDLEIMNKAVEYGGSNSNIFRKLAGEQGASNFIHNALGISVPLGLGGYGLYSTNNQQKQLQYQKQGGKMNTLQFLKNGSGIHIKKKNRGKFTDYCGGKVTDSCIRRAKASGNPTLVKRATFAANARKWKHAKGGILYGSEGIDLGYDMNQGMDVGMDYGMDPDLKKNKKATAPVDSKGDQKEAYDWFKQRYSNVNWNNMNYIYNQFKRAGIPYDTAIAVMGNIVHESQGDPRRRQVGGGPGYGLLQWNKGTEPGDTLVAQTRGIISALKNPASQSNYWYHGGAGSGFRTGADAQRYIMSKNNYNFTNKTKVFSSSYLRPGKPHLEDRIKSSRLLARLYKEYNKGGIL